MTRTRRAVETAITDDAKLDPPTRRGLLTIADHVDELVREVESLRKTVLGTGGAIVLALVSAAISTIIR